MKIALLGGGGFRVPMVYRALLARATTLGIDEVVLHDLEATRLDRIMAVLEGIQREAGTRLAVRATLDLDDAVDGADFVFCAIRVGRLEGRVVDESVPLAEGVVGQETTGPGGIGYALRTVPVMLDIAERVARRAPDAWFINFTNPAGLVTEALADVLGDRVIGICDSPAGLCRRVATALGCDPGELEFDYAGLNHLGWLQSVRRAGQDLLPGLLADDGRLERFLEGRLFGGEWLRTIASVPNEYLYFYYFSTETVAALRSGVEPRAAYLLRQQAAFYAAVDATPEAALARWRAARRERDETYFAEARSAAGLGTEPLLHDRAEGEESEGYEAIALATVEAIALDRRATLIVNVPNRGSLPFLDDRAVVELPCVVGRNGARPLAVDPLPDHARVLVEAVKVAERLAIRAARERSRSIAVAALAVHPLVPSVGVARRIFERFAAGQPELRDWPA